MIRFRVSLVALVVVVALPAAAAATTSIYSRVLGAYQQNGSIPPCQFSSAQLSRALQGVDTYGAQYFSDFTSAIQAALAARAAGQCTARPAATAPLTGAAGTTRTAPPAPRSLTAPTGASLPLPLIVLGVLAALAVLVAALTALIRGLGREPPLLAAWSHSWREAGYRLGGSWAEFVDWLRPGSHP